MSKSIKISVIIILVFGFLSFFYKLIFIDYPTSAFVHAPVLNDLNSDTLLALTTQYRVNKDIGPLKKSELLCKFANLRVDELIKTQVFSHEGFYPLSKTYSTIYPFLGENLAKNFSLNDDILQSWLNSPGHKENIERPLYTDACVAIKDIYTVMIYGRPSSN